LSKTKIWNSSEWTKKAYQLIKGLDEFPKDKKIIMIIRHSHRYDSNNLWEHEKDTLTPLGHEIAREFGEHLPKNRHIRLFHSKVERCRETASNIHKGFLENNGSSEVIGSLKLLFDIEISREDFYREAKKYPLNHLLYRWAAGLYPESMVLPFKKYIIKAANEIWNKIDKAPQRGIDIHVSHDFILMCLRLGWFGLNTGEKYPSFLSGFAFCFDDDRILLYDYDHLGTIEIPYWWKKE
jgi:hypothetical protein